MSCIPSILQAPQGMDFQTIVMNLLPIVAIFVVFYFLLIRPQQKKQKEMKKMLASLKKGDKIITIGGIHGTVVHAKDDEKNVVIKVDENTTIEFLRSAISEILNRKPADSETKEQESEKK